MNLEYIIKQVMQENNTDQVNVIADKKTSLNGHILWKVIPIKKEEKKYVVSKSK